MSARVGIVDDHPAVILGLRGIIDAEPDLSVVAIGRTVAELLSGTTEFDMVLLDLVLADDSRPGNNVKALLDYNIPVLVYTSGDLPKLVREAAIAGAMGMIRKSELPSAIVDAVRTTLAGGVVATADWAAALESDPELVAANLTRREIEVLGLYAAGETAERVGAQLFISRETVLDHIRRIRVKYAASGRPAHTKVDLYRRAVEDGIVPDPN